MNIPRPTLIAHRGASAYRPEHTIAGYQLAIDQGADIIEPDLVITKDGILIVRHENELTETTNVADHPEFASRKTRKNIDGIEKEGWFAEDFTLQEIKTLRAKERIPQYRPANTLYDNQYEIATFQQVIDLMKKVNSDPARKRTIGIYPETKHPSYFQSIGLPLEEPLIRILEENGLNHRDAHVFIQSFEVANLKALRSLTPLPLVQLVDEAGSRPYDFVLAGAAENRTSDDLLTPSGLKEMSTYANVVSPYKYWIIPRDKHDNLDVAKTSSIVADAHKVGLLVHIWTMRPENHFLPASLKSDGNETHVAEGSVSEIKTFLYAGIDGFFSDASDKGREAINEYLKEKNVSHGELK